MQIKISDIPHNRDKFSTKGIIIDELETKILKNDEFVKIYLLADESGCIEYGLYNETVSVGDIIQLDNSYALFKNNRFRVFAGDNKNIRRIGTFTMLFVNEPNFSNTITE